MAPTTVPSACPRRPRGAVSAARARAGTAAGLLAFAGPGVLHADADPLYRELVAGRDLPAVIASGAAGLAALAPVLRRRDKAARHVAALAVAAIVAGWALAQEPRLLPGLTVDYATAPRDVC